MQAKNKNKDEKMKNTKILCKAAIVGGLLLGTGGLYAVEAPKISLKQSKNMMDMMVNVLSIVSTDNDTKINDIIVNRGNCPIEKYGGVDYQKAKAYADKYPENAKIATKEEQNRSFFSDKYPVFLDDHKFVLYLYTKDGNSVMAKPGVRKNDKKTEAYLDSLTDEAREIYENKLPVVKNFGERFDIELGCSFNDVLEIVISTDGGDFKYETNK